MTAKTRTLCKLSIAVVALCLLSSATVMMHGQTVRNEPVGMVEDWSHHHLVFSNPGTADEAAVENRFEDWLKITNNPRYKLQQLRRNLGHRSLVATPSTAAPAATASASTAEAISNAKAPVKKPPKVTVSKDWSMDMGGTAASLILTVATPTTSNLPSSPTQSFILDTHTFTASNPTSESTTLTISSLPTTTTNATVTVSNSTGPNTFTLTENGAVATATGAFATPQTTTATLLTITSGPSTIHVTTTATAASFPLTLDSGGETTTGSITYTYTGGASSVAIKISPVASGGGAACTLTSGTYTGTFNESTLNTTAATNFLNELNLCLGSSYANIASSFTTARATATVTLTDTYLGNFLTVANTLGSTTGIITSGGNGTAACTLAGSTYTVDYVSSNSTSTMASNLLSELNACAAGADIHASNQSGASLTISSTVLGTGSFATSATGVFNYTSTNDGSDGSPACGSSGSSGNTFGTGTTTGAVATALRAALILCSGAIQAQTGINASATVTGSGVNIFAYIPGTTGGSGISVAAGAGLSTSGGGALAGGSDGTTSATLFKYWTGNQYDTQDQLEQDLINSFADEFGTPGTFSYTIDSGATAGNLLITNNTPGTAGDGITSTSTAGGAVTGGTFAGGTQATVGADNYPAKFSFDTSTANCASDFVVYNTGVAGSGNQASIVAYSNLYSGCGGSLPSVYWAYNTGDTVLTSVVLSYDGSQVAFVDSADNLVILRWAANNGTVTSPVSPMPYSAANYNSDCTAGTAPCMTTIALSGATSDTNSSPYYEYDFDTLWAGDNGGILHEVTGVFLGTPTESSSGWPVTIGGVLTSPVFNSNSGEVFVGSSNGKLSYVSNAGGTPTASAVLSATGSTGIVDGPLVDVTSSGVNVYAFVGDDGGTIACPTGGGPPCGGVYRFATSFAATTKGTEVQIGSTTTSNIVYDGDFDDLHYSGTATTGNLYVCGAVYTGNVPRMYRIPMSTFTIATADYLPLTTATSGTGASACSPVTEFKGNAHDWIFVSVPAKGGGTGYPCTGACLYNFNVDTPPADTTLPTAGLTVTGGASGVIIDNLVLSGTLAGASQIYFSNLGSTTCSTSGGTGGCAVQAGQAAP